MEEHCADVEHCEDELREDDVEAPIYKIATYDEWIKYNPEISKIIITNKKSEVGFIRFTRGLWITLHERTKFDDVDHLLGFIQNYQCRYLYKNKITNEIITNDDYLKLNDHENINYENNIIIKYNDAEILKDTLNKCYVTKCDSYTLNYHEYVLPSNQSSSTTSYVIFNSKNIAFTPVDELISDKILTCREVGSDFFYAKNIINTNIIGDIFKSFVSKTLPNDVLYTINNFYVQNIINTDIVDDILKSLVPNDIIKEYKKLMNNLIVKQEEKQIIFFDYNECLLTTWIKDILHTISNSKFYALSCDYYSDKSKFMKLHNTHKYRCVVIKKYMNVSIEKQINDFCKLGFSNIIVCQKDERNTMYNIENFRKQLNDNKEKIMQCIKEENNYVIDNWEYEIQYNDEIFSRQNLLLTNFLIWCCMK